MIRTEEQDDWPAVHRLNTAAFETRAEADLVEALRGEAHPIISLVAEKAGSVVGHILLSPVTISGHPGSKMMGLGPMAVAPAHQRQGIGSALVDAAIERCRAFDIGAIVVLGHPAYYPRFGFSPSVHFGLSSEYEVPDEVFMVAELQSGFLKTVSGTVEYHHVFKNV